MNWNTNSTDYYLNKEYQHSFEFLHGIDRYSVAKEEDPTFAGVDSLILYTLTPGVSTSYADVKLCKEICSDSVLSKKAINLFLATAALMGSLLFTTAI